MLEEKPVQSATMKEQEAACVIHMFAPSVGTPATTTQGMGVEEMKTIASLISRAIRSEDPSVLAGIKSEVHALTSKFPIYNA